MNPNSSDPNTAPQNDEATPQTTPEQAPVSTDAPVTPFTSEPSPSTSTPPEATPGAAPEVVPATSPVNDAQGASPFTAAPVAGGTPGPITNGPEKNKALKIAAIIAGVVVLAIVAVVVYLMMTTVSKADYRDAATKFNEVSRASTQLNTEAASLGRSVNGSNSDSEFSASLTEAKDAISNLSTKNEELGKLKAVRVGEGAELYKTFDDKLDAYVAYGNDLIKSVENLRPAMVVCDGVSDASDNAARVTAMKECSTALNAVSDLPNESFKKFVDSLKTNYAKLATSMEKLAGITSPFGAQAAEYRALRDEVSDVTSSVSTASSEFTKSLRESDDKYSVKDSADALGDYLTEQQRN